MSPEEEAFLRIIAAYQRGGVTLDDAAQQLLALNRAHPTMSINLEVSPSIRRLFAETQRLAGQQPDSIEPDPDRHADKGHNLLRDLKTHIWKALERHPRANEPLSIMCHFAAATEDRARQLVAWLEAHGSHKVRLESPVEADADDWIIRAYTPKLHWTKTLAHEWAASIRAAPFGGEASFTGWGV
jgi:hypothetical protein